MLSHPEERGVWNIKGLVGEGLSSAGLIRALPFACSQIGGVQNNATIHISRGDRIAGVRRTAHVAGEAGGAQGVLFCCHASHWPWAQVWRGAVPAISSCCVPAC